MNNEFRKWYYREKYHPSDWEKISIPIYRYQGEDEITPEFTDDDPGACAALLYIARLSNGRTWPTEGFHVYCTIKAETSEMIRSVRPTYSVNDTEYLRLKYSVILYLGLTELQAELSWIENVSTFRRLLAAVVLTPSTIQGEERRCVCWKFKRWARFPANNKTDVQQRWFTGVQRQSRRLDTRFV